MLLSQMISFNVKNLKHRNVIRIFATRPIN